MKNNTWVFSESSPNSPRASGHLDFYRDSMYSPIDIDGMEYLLKPMNCPFHIQMYNSRRRSYRDLPFRWAELGTCYRYESAGTLHGLMRVRGFTQDDAHLFLRPDQLDAEVERCLKFVLHILRAFDFTEFHLMLSTRPEKFVGEIAQWDKSELSLEKALKALDLDYTVDPGGGAFYGPKVDVNIKDLDNAQTRVVELEAPISCAEDAAENPDQP